jgi:hypothetical protein
MFLKVESWHPPQFSDLRFPQEDQGRVTSSPASFPDPCDTSFIDKDDMWNIQSPPKGRGCPGKSTSLVSKKGRRSAQWCHCVTGETPIHLGRLPPLSYPEHSAAAPTPVACDLSISLVSPPHWPECFTKTDAPCASVVLKAVRTYFSWSRTWLRAVGWNWFCKPS